jgi:hypothetical protein
MAFDFARTSRVLPSGRTAYFGQLIGTTQPEFLIGNRTKYQDNFGIFNITTSPGLVYQPADYEDKFGFWAQFIYPTAMAESRGSFMCLNTYDRAKFTFSFMQYAAHVPNGDFVIFLKELLGLENAKQYFPRLELQNGRIHYKRTNGTLVQLETDNSTKNLMDYFNPTLSEVEEQELICAARLVHWAANDPAHRTIQVDIAIEHFKKNMIVYDRRFNLDGVPAKVCLLICDIRHQGRSTNDRIAFALNTNNDFEEAFSNLCTIGEVNYQSRINTVRRTIEELSQDGSFNKRYHRATNNFINA